MLTSSPPASAAGAAPTVDVGADQTVRLGDTAFLRGRVADDGLPKSSELGIAWTVVRGPGRVTFGKRDEALTTARFSAAGRYVLRLAVSDGGATARDALTVTVRKGTPAALRVPADYPTIQAALDAAPLHGLVLVAPGTYKEQPHVPRTVTLASTFYTTRDRSRIERTVISGVSSEEQTLTVATAAAPDTRVVGFTIQGGKDGIKVRGAAVVEHNVFRNLLTDAVDMPGGSAALIQHNVMRDNGDDGVDLGRSSAVVVDNLMRENAGDGIETRVTNTVSDAPSAIDVIIVRGNRIVFNDDDGLQIIDNDDIASSAAQSSTLFTIDRNVIANNRQAGLGLMDKATTSEDYRGAGLVERIVVTNNTFDGNNHGITGGANMVVVNNVFSGHPGIALKNVNGDSRTAYNHFFANGVRSAGSNVHLATAYGGNPMLDAAYRPRPGSPLVDAGTEKYALSGERAIWIRSYRGSAPDIGALESAAVGLQTRITSGPRPYITSFPVTLRFASSKAGSRFRCRLDGRVLPCARSSVRIRGTAPGTHRFSVAAVGSAGRVDSSPATRTWTVPRDDTSLRHNRGWVERRAAGHYRGTYSQAARQRAALTTRISRATGLALVASVGPGQGTVLVFLEGRRLKQIDLAAPRERKRVVIPVAGFNKPRSGGLRIVVVSRGKPVRVDALGVRTR
jgi:hypothetical protein